MTNKEKAWELSKMLAKYADDEESYFEFAGNVDKRTYTFPTMESNLSKWKVSKNTRGVPNHE